MAPRPERCPPWASLEFPPDDAARAARRRRDRSAAGRSGARRCADRGTCLPQRGRHTGDALFLRAGLRGRRPRVRPRRGAPRSGRAGVRAAARHSACRRWWCRACARRWGRWPPPSTATHGAAAGGRRDGHERQDDDRLPRAPRARGGRASGPACSARCTRSSAASVEEVERTTPEAVDLQATFARMLDGRRPGVRDGGVLARARRCTARPRIEFDCAVFTNLTQDHLDFHGTLDDYYAAKQKLFLPADGRPADGRRRERRRRVGPQASPARSPQPATRGSSRSRSTATPTTAPAACATTRPGSSFECATAAGAVEVRVPLPGLFNVYNALAAIAAARRARRAAGRGRGRARRRAPRVPGRFEPIEEGQGFGVLVDYAHTPDSLENVLVSARELLEQAGGEGRLIVRVRRGRRPRPGEAPADGRGGAAPRRPHGRDLATTRARRSRTRSSPRSSPAPRAPLRRARAPPWRSRPTAAPRSSARWRWRGPATSS